MDALGSALKAYKIGKVVRGIATGTNPLGAAIGATLLVKDYVDSERSKVHRAVLDAEGCAHIQMLEAFWGAPTPSAFGYVADHGGVAWRPGQSPLYFWHPERFFKPTLFSQAFVRVDGAHSTVHIVNSDLEFRQRVLLQKGFGYGCRRCYDARSAANRK